MKTSSSRWQIDSKVPDDFWPLNSELGRNGAPPPARPSAAANLYDLFVHELSLLVAGACHADRMAQVFFAAFAPEQIRLRQLVLGLARCARGCLPALPAALTAEGLELPSARDRVVDVLLQPVNPSRRGPLASEPCCVAGARTVGAFSDVTRHFEAALARTAEDARLLGSDRLHHALASWASMWGDYRQDLSLREQSFRAQAYGAGLSSHGFGGNPPRSTRTLNPLRLCFATPSSS